MWCRLPICSPTLSSFTVISCYNITDSGRKRNTFPPRNKLFDQLAAALLFSILLSMLHNLTMRVLIISDIHGNLAALESVLGRGGGPV